MSIITTLVKRFVAPALPNPTPEYDQRYFDKFNSILRLYFNQLDQLLGQLVSGTTTVPVSIGGTNVDAFGRLRVSNPFTLFDSQNRYAADNQYDTSTATGGTLTYLPNETSCALAVTTTSGSEVVRQTFRNFAYQPGKSLLSLMTFTMAPGQTNLRQRVGYFNTQNGVFFQQDGTTLSFVLRSSSLPTPGTPSDVRTIPQSSWNGDKLDGTGASGIVLDVTKTQILWMDFEWLGVGRVRCGFFQDGDFVVCHTFDNENVQTAVYMTTAILPLRYEITATGTLSSTATLKQICSTVISEGGYAQTVVETVVRRTTLLNTIGNTFLPILSVRLNSSTLGALVLFNQAQVLPTTSQNYEVCLVRNPTGLTGASWVTGTFQNMDYDVSATAMTIPNATAIIRSDYVTSTSQGRQVLSANNDYNFDYQIGASIAGVSDILTLGIRTVSGATTGDAIASMAFYDLTV